MMISLRVLVSLLPFALYSSLEFDSNSIADCVSIKHLILSGSKGIQGPQGFLGLPGTQGPMGISGVKGEEGKMGPSGPSGECGDMGMKGL